MNQLNHQHLAVTRESLNKEQLLAAQQVLERSKSAFITGGAGTGKSHVLKYIIQNLQDIHGPSAVGVTAPTGAAAINVGGQTIHSFAGIGIGQGSKEHLTWKVKRSKNAIERWTSAKVLIIDEVSMLDMDLFDTLDHIARHVRENLKAPFGGLQVVTVGDFFQLPPVENGDAFCFRSKAWRELGLLDKDNKIELRQVVRQNDIGFINLLNAVRIGVVTPLTTQILARHLVSLKPTPKDGIVPTRVFCTNKDVDRENIDRLNEIQGQVVQCIAQDKVVYEPSHDPAATKKAILESIDKFVPRILNLKVGAQVMLLKNRGPSTSGTPSNLASGSRGVVVKFDERGDKMLPVVRFDDGQVINVAYVETLQSGPDGDGQISRSQIPLKLAWAVTVHKSQGLTLSRAVLEIASAFDYGQAYVALSRVSSLTGLWLTRPINRQSIKAHPLVLDFYGYAPNGTVLPARRAENITGEPKQNQTVVPTNIPSSLE